MVLLYPDEYFLELLEEDIYNLNKDSCDYSMVSMDLNSIIDELDREYVESIMRI